MSNPGNLIVTTPSDREIAMTRAFDALSRLVWDALTQPHLLKRWFLGPDGWTLAVCEIDLRVGGAYRYLWTHPGRDDLGISGVYREIVPHRRIVNTERFDQSWYPGEALNTWVLEEQGGQTTLTITSRFESREGRDIALQSGMERGVEASFNRLANVLASTLAGEDKRARA
jgi:uncharacterized protein YndB with AHSA1/START domain